MNECTYVSFEVEQNHVLIWGLIANDGDAGDGGAGGGDETEQFATAQHRRHCQHAQHTTTAHLIAAITNNTFPMHKLFDTTYHDTSNRKFDTKIYFH